MKADKKDILNRLARVQGHLNAVRRMVDEDRYCVDILLQSLAVQHALRKVDQELLKNHLNCCVVSAIRKNNGKEKLAELLKIYKVATENI